MSHSVAELYAETITAPSPCQLKGRMYYIDEWDEEAEKQRTLDSIHETWLAHVAANDRRVRLERERRAKYVTFTITLPLWLSIVYRFIWRR